MRGRLAIVICCLAATFTSPLASAGFDEAMEHYGGKRFAEAATEFKTLIDADPAYDYGHFMHGVCSYRLNQNDIAIASLTKAIELEGQKFAYHNALATAQLRKRDYRAALTTLDRAAGLARSDREKLELHRNRATANVQLERYREALTELDRVSILTTKVTLPRSSRFSTDLSLERGVCHLHLDDLDAAITSFESVLALQESRSDAHAYLTAAHVLRARAATGVSRRASYQRAVEHGKRALQAGAGDVATRRRLGEAQMGLGDYRAAAGSFRKVLERDPKSCSARINLGKCQIGAGNWDAVIATLSRARKCAPTAARKAGVVEGLALARLKRGELEVSAQLYREAGRLAPLSASIREGAKLVAARIERRAAKAEEDAVARKAEEEYLKSLAEFEEQQKKREAWDGPEGGEQ